MKYPSILKILALTLACALLCTALVGCGKARPIKSTEEELAAVGTVGSYEIPYEELRYLTLQYRDLMEATYGEGIWDDDASREQYRAELERAVTENITANYAVLELCAEVQISHTDEVIEKAVQKYVQSMVDELGGVKEYKAQLAEQHLTDRLVRFNLAVTMCENELLYVYTDDLGLIADGDEEIYDIVMSDAFARTLHIYIENNPGESVEDNRAEAEAILQKLEQGENFHTLIGRHSEDLYMTTTNGYYFTHGEMIEEYEQAAFALEIGQISGIVETDGGFYIIQRLAPETEYVMSNLTALIDQYQYAMLYNMVDERQDTLTFVLNEYGASLDLTTLQ